MDPIPDTKDWTWTLSRRCDECGLAAGEIDIAEVAKRAELAAGEWVQILRSSPAVASRPEPDVWSPLEYGAHVRDVFGLFDARMGRLLTEDGPTFANWDQDATAIAEGYATQDPDEVADELTEAAAHFVARLSALTPTDLGRAGYRSDGAKFTVTTLGQYFLHDVVHHLWDVTGQRDGLESLR